MVPPLARLRVQIVKARGLAARDANGKSDPYVVVSIPGVRLTSSASSSLPSSSSSSSSSSKLRTPTKKSTLDPVWSPAEATFDINVDLSWFGLPTGSSPLSQSPRRTLRPLRKAVSHLRLHSPKSPAPSTASAPVSTVSDEVVPSIDTLDEDAAPAVHALEFVLWDADRFSAADYLGEHSLTVDHWATLDASGQQKLVAWGDAEPIVLPLSSMRKFQGVKGDLVVKVGFLPPVGPVPEPGTPGEPLSEAQSRELQSLYARLVFPLDDVPAVRSVPADRTIGMTDDNDAFIYTDENEAEADEEEDELDEQASTHSDSDSFHSAHYRSIAGVPDGPSQPLTDSGASHTPEAGVHEHTAQPKSRLIHRIRHKSTPSSASSRTAVSSTTESSEVFQAVTSSQSRVRRPTISHRRRRRHRRSLVKGALADAQHAGSFNSLGVALIEVKSASNLPRWPNMAKTSFDMDPFTIVSFSQRVYRTAVVRHNLNPVWNQKMMLPIEERERNYRIKFNVFDWDRVSTHDEIGIASLSIADLIDARHAQLEAEGGGRDPVTGLYPMHILKRETDISSGARTLTLNLRQRAGGEATLEDSMPIITEKGKPCTLTVMAHFQPFALLRQRLWYRLLLHYDEDENHSLSRLALEAMLVSLNSTISNETIRSWFTMAGKDPDQDDEITFEEAIMALERTTHATSDPSRRPTMEPAASLPNLETKVHKLDVTDKDANATASSLNLPSTPSSEAEPLPSSRDEETRPERLIQLDLCPMCRKQTLTNWSVFGVVTHVAVCASRDWSQVDNFAVRSYVTESQAHRKWYTKAFKYVAQGKYQLGANNANLIVTDRATGEYLEEHMAIYVRLGIRLMYQAGRSRMEGRRVQRLLKSLTLKQGRKYDDPASVKDIGPFVKFHHLNLDEILLPLEEFKTFNQFFYRQLKPDARPLEDPGNSLRVVSAADCRLMCFPSVTEAKRIWIKGQGFSVRTLLDEALPDEETIAKLEQGALGIFRLAPQDYHRFHMPITGKIISAMTVGTSYYTVNPMAIRSSSIDVYGDNHRVVVRCESPDGFGTFYMICVGAMMVGTTVLTKSVGDTVQRGDELGYFAFGGSTVVTLFEQNRLAFDDDLLDNSNKAVETLVKVGMGIARAI